MRTLGHREIVKLDQSLPARKGQEWDSNPSSEAQWPILNPPPPPQLSLGHSAGGNSDGFGDAVLLWVHRISVLRHITSEMARLHLGHAGVLGIYAVVGGGPFSSS